VPGLCKKLEISYLKIYCDPATDPIQPFLSQAGTNAVCAESNGLLRTFGGFNGYVRQTGINADVVHLFHGKDFTGTSTIGCAYIGTLCNPSRGMRVRALSCDISGTEGVGVNEISYTGSLDMQSKIVAYEKICLIEKLLRPLAPRLRTPYTSPDAQPNAGPNASPHCRPNAGPDTCPDTCPDASPHTCPDASSHTRPDTSADTNRYYTSSETSFDTSSDASSYTYSDVRPNSSPHASPDTQGVQGRPVLSRRGEAVR
jgi:hypothetical protein